MIKRGNSKGYKIIAVDFDDTLFERGVKGYPHIGNPITSNVQWVLEQKRLGHKIILWTCRDGKELEDAVKKCEKQGIVFDAINDNIEKEDNERLSRKIYASIYFDDKSLNPITHPEDKNFSF